MPRKDPRKHGQAARLLWIRYELLVKDGHEEEAACVKLAAEALEEAQRLSEVDDG